LRQAGDWDLCRRFAAETSYYSADVILAVLRRREDQLTADKGAYYHEVDQVSGDELACRYESELMRFRAWEADTEEDRVCGITRAAMDCTAYSYAFAISILAFD
jgi:hypothetical protein